MARANRQKEWTESIAVGSERFTQGIKEKLGLHAKGREIFRNPRATANLEKSLRSTVMILSQKEIAVELKTHIYGILIYLLTVLYGVSLIRELLAIKIWAIL